MNIGQKLKNTRLTVGLTQESVAEEIGISRQTISNWAMALIIGTW
jgi:DNA-binding XRE family transcriptional regulator